MSMSKSISNTLILVLACIGCFVTLVLVYEHFRPNADIGCMAIGGNCRAANESKYGHIGKVPTSVFGLAMYATFVGLCLKRRKLLSENNLPSSLPAYPPDVDDDEPASSDTLSGSYGPPKDRPFPGPDRVAPSSAALRRLDTAVWLIAAPAVVISIWLQKVSLYQLVSFCPWCMTSAFLVTLIFLLASKDMFLDNRKLVGEQKLLAATVTFISAMAVLMGAPDVLMRIRIAQAPIFAAHQGPVNFTDKQPPLVTKDMEVTGPTAAPFLVVEFADYQCPHCQKSSVYLAEMMKKNPEKYRLAFRNYPLPIHHWASQAAVAAEAAGEQSKFWEMHDYIFAHQAEMDKPTFGPDTFKQYATDLGLNADKFERDESSDKVVNRVAVDASAAPQLKIVMTPTFFVVNKQGKVYQLTGLDQLKAAMDDPDNKAWK